MSATLKPTARPRVLHCVTHLALGGAERVALTLSAALQGEFDFSFYAVRGLGDGAVGRVLADELTALQIPLRVGPRIPMRFGGMLSGGIGLGRAIRRFEPDLVHLHTEIPEASYAAMTVLRPAFRSIPLVRTIHNAVIWQFWRSLGRWCDRRMPMPFVAGVSQDAVDAFLQLRRESGAPALCQLPNVIYNGVSPAPVAAHRTRSPDDPIRVVFAGRLETEKGADLLPQILALARPPERRAAHLVVFGSGRFAEVLRSLVQKPPPGWTVELLPPAPDFRQRLASFDLAIVPSRHEGLSLATIEAFLAGLAVVVTDATGLREAVPPNYPWQTKAGDAASFSAALSEALACPHRWTELAEVGRIFAQQKFSVSAMAEGYRRLYRGALASKAGIEEKEARSRP